METELILLLLAVALAAGWVDAVVGGGGLVQLPVLLLALPAAPPPAVLATDKLSSISGTTVSAVGFARSVRMEARVAVPATALAIALSGAGALTAGRVPSELFRPFVLVMLALVAALVIARPGLGTRERRRPARRRSVVAAVLLVGVVLPFYNGLVGPGTGALILFALTTLLGLDFVMGSATAKVVNVGANLGALVVFAAHGQVFWLLGLAMASCNVLGARLGTRTALRRGAAFIRATLLCVVAALIVKLGLDQLRL
ncbi:sulfite exporter TauE/SafE family protein [Nonomuraea sp. bgisy101]|uniref:sulfite exporter TauE/SafE family protein n=1 Tax=Nonomuraea sp. bgisy101 TaxID=3413784 RepID=UPI003D750200